MVVSEVFINGWGAVSPAGWGMAALRAALSGNRFIEPSEMPRPGWSRPLRVRRVPPPETRPLFLANGRLRRTSPVAHYAVGAALEALGADTQRNDKSAKRLGIVLCALSGCVNYSRRFYDEVLKDPATASPLLFPETVYNSPASHLAALLGTTEINYTLVGDPGIFLQGVALAADWLDSDRVDGCLVIGTEERDWLVADAMRLFSRETILADGAGALYLSREPNTAEAFQLNAVTNPHLFSQKVSRAEAAKAARAELPVGGQLLCDGLAGVSRVDCGEHAAWADWTGARISPKKILGEGLMAAAAWQCVAALDALVQTGYTSVNVSTVGCNQQAIAARFLKVRR